MLAAGQTPLSGGASALPATGRRNNEWNESYLALSVVFFAAALALGTVVLREGWKRR